MAIDLSTLLEAAGEFAPHAQAVEVMPVRPPNPAGNRTNFGVFPKKRTDSRARPLFDTEIVGKFPTANYSSPVNASSTLPILRRSFTLIPPALTLVRTFSVALIWLSFRQEDLR